MCPNDNPFIFKDPDLLTPENHLPSALTHFVVINAILHQMPALHAKYTPILTILVVVCPRAGTITLILELLQLSAISNKLWLAA